MSGQAWLPYLLFGIAAVSLFAIGRMKARRTAPQRIADNGKTPMMSLLEAAQAAYETARRERMVIVTVAERATELQSLYIRKQDYQTYVRWARSMQ